MRVRLAFVFAELLTRPDVTEHVDLRSRVGFMAFHGGTLEKVTDIIATEAAAAAGASYYGVVQSAEDPTHLPSTEVSPEASPAMAEFFDHVDTVITVHGYGRKTRLFDVLLGGQNRALALHVRAHLQPVLPDYRFVADLDDIPRELAGQHPRNPVNRALNRGVQIELSPAIRWNRAEWGWSDQGAIGRAQQVDTLIEALAGAVRSWPA